MAKGQNYGINSSKVADQIFSENSVFDKLVPRAAGEFVNANTLRVFTNSTSPLIAYVEGSATPLAATGGTVVQDNDTTDYVIAHSIGQARYIPNLLTTANPAATVANIQNAMLVEQVAPMHDLYAFGRIASLATNPHLTWKKGDAAGNARNIVQAAVTTLRNHKVPLNTLIGVATQDFVFDALNTLGSASDSGFNAQVNNNVATIAGIKFTIVADTVLPTSTAAEIFSTSSIMAPRIINKVRVINDVPGFDGTELLFHYVDDTFVLTNKANGIIIVDIATS